MKQTMWVTVLAVGILALAAPASVVQVNDHHGGSQDFFAASATDLINLGQPSLASFEASNLTYGDGNVLIDGTSAHAIGAGADWGGWGATFYLDTTANPLGYNVTEIKSIAGWGDGRANQEILIMYRPVGQTDFVTLGRYANGLAVEANPDGQCTQISLTDSEGGFVLSGIDAIHIGVSQYTIMKEVDVFGAPVPEPMTIGLLAMGGLLLRRRS